MHSREVKVCQRLVVAIAAVRLYYTLLVALSLQGSMRILIAVSGTYSYPVAYLVTV
jgi:hypothetical protein